MAAKIVIRHVGNSSLAGRTHEFESEVVRLGRREGNDVVFDPRQDTLVSGSHAEVRLAGGRVVVSDVGSTNGTYVNGQRLTGPMPIGAHDRVTLGAGGPEMRIELAGAPAYAPQQPAFGTPAGGGYPPPAPAYQPNPNLQVTQGLQPAAVASAHAGAAAVAAPPPMGFAPPAFSPPAFASGPPPAAPVEAKPFAAPPVPGFEMPHPKPFAGTERPVSRMAQGLPNRPIGMNTLMGVLEKSRTDERKRMFYIVGPIVLVLLGAVTFFLIRGQNAPPVVVQQTPTSPASTNPASRPAEATWADVYKKVEPSVYMIQAYKVVDGRNVFFNSGTGWSVKPGLLATNAHVSALYDMVQPNGFVIARRGKPENDLRITKVRPHPGYAQAARMGLDYRPFSPDNGEFTKATSLNACDVAILEVHADDVKKQGPPLPLAATGAVESGTKVAYLGFPVEGSVAVNRAEPSPYTNDAAVTRLLGLLAENTHPGQETFVGHSLNTLGGSSGSPIVNLKGEVVAVNFAGDNVGSVGEGRIVLAGFNYGVPVDMVKDLLDPATLDAKQEARRKQWEVVLDKAFREGVAKPKALIEQLMQASAARIAAKKKLQISEMVAQAVTSESTTVKGNATARLTCPAQGEYVIVTVGDRPGDKLEVDLALGTESAMVNDFVVDGKPRRVYWGTATATIATAGTNLQLKMTADQPTTVTYAMYLIKPK